jgi:hypothetical protein
LFTAVLFLEIRFDPSPEDLKRRLPFLSNFVRQQAGAVDNGQHVDLILLYAVDDPVGFFDQLADIVNLVLGHHAAR